MGDLLKTYNTAIELLKHKDELLKYPDTFEAVLHSLRKAIDDEYGEGFSVVDDPNESGEGDEAEKWLQEHGSKEGASQEKQVRRMADWQPRSDYSDSEKAAIEQHMKDGYTHREAERMAGAHKGPMDFISAMRSGVNPSMMSQKMMGQLKPLAKLWLQEADKEDKRRADPEINPLKHASGKMAEAHEKNTSKFNDAYNQFLGSDAVKGLKGKDRHMAIQQWKSDWKKSNPEHDAGLADVSSTQKLFSEARGAAKQNLNEKIAHIMGGGQSMPTEMTEAEAMQHLGGGKSEEGYHGSIVQDPSASFATRNPKLIASLKPEQQERLKMIDSAAQSQGKIRRRPGPGGGQ